MPSRTGAKTPGMAAVARARARPARCRAPRACRGQVGGDDGDRQAQLGEGRVAYSWRVIMVMREAEISDERQATACLVAGEVGHEGRTMSIASGALPHRAKASATAPPCSSRR